ncbi:GNAT family N-acetyltransferase [Paenibacillus apiarius]|uniref:GNAT family N-acetyltransferase n=1 Tax=Paenibacillus apiarius TaxID=46240 RepID=UPI0019818579|nr:GNAT family N-acetyltransferase [Paenibacillus apiarius]MBN3523866.1 GNAT family N-acetyltransferase [Paenibacillus apiarius]
MNFRLATLDDCDWIYRIRNSWEIRRQCIDMSPIVYESHQKWFSEALTRADMKIWIYVNEKNNIGMLRLDMKEQFLLINIFVDPSCNNRGHGSQMLSHLNELVKAEFPKYNKVVAVIKKDNRASVRLFEKASFSKGKEDETFFEYIYRIR